MPKGPAVPTFLHPSLKKVGCFGLLAAGFLPIRRAGSTIRLLLSYLTSLAVCLLLPTRQPGSAAHLCPKPQTNLAVDLLLLLERRTGSSTAGRVGVS